MLNGKAPIVYSSVGLIKKTKWKWVNIFQNQNPEGKVKVELDLSNYAKKVDLKNTSGLDTSKLVKRLT